MDRPVIEIGPDAYLAERCEQIFVRTPIFNRLKIFTKAHADVGMLFMDNDLITSPGQLNRSGEPSRTSSSDRNCPRLGHVRILKLSLSVRSLSIGTTRQIGLA